MAQRSCPEAGLCAVTLCAFLQSTNYFYCILFFKTKFVQNVVFGQSPLGRGEIQPECSVTIKKLVVCHKHSLTVARHNKYYKQTTDDIQ